MSLHRRIVPPPLAVSISLLPTSKPSDKSKEKEKETKDTNKEKKDEKKSVHGDDDDKNEKGDKPTPPVLVAKKDTKEGPANGKIAIPDADGKGLQAENPNSPASIFPEPPTSAPGAGDGATEAEEDAKDKAKKDENDAKKGDVNGKVPAPNPAPKDDEGKEVNKSDKSSEADKEKKSADEAKATSDAEANAEDKSKDPPPPPLLLLPPAPYRPLRTQLNHPPTAPYPPINTDPRGAYYKYARAVGSQEIYIDITKDGWLVEQWRERSEREAMKRLTGEWEKELEREIEKERKKAIKRKVPKESGEILVQLWNDLVEANMHEISVQEFWDRYDWSDPEAQIHLRTDIKRHQTEAEIKIKEEHEKAKAKAKANEAKKSEEDKTDPPTATISTTATTSDEAETKTTSIDEKVEDVKSDEHKQGDEAPLTEWTKDGLEGVLATVGVQCNYNIPRLPSSLRDRVEPPMGYLLLAHSHFLLRRDDQINWRPEKESNEFQALVTTPHDRVFGAMVRAQMMEEKKKKEKEYRERKEREYKERKEREKKEGKDKGKGDSGEKKEKDEGDSGEKKQNEEAEKEIDDQKEKAEKVKGEKEEKKEEKDTKKDKNAVIEHEKEDQPKPDAAPRAPSIPESNVKVHDGEPIVAHHEETPAISPDVVVVPVDGEAEKKDAAGGDKAKERDAKHDQEAELVPGPKVATVEQPKPQGQSPNEGEKPNMEGIAKAFDALDEVVKKDNKAVAAVAKGKKADSDANLDNKVEGGDDPKDKKQDQVKVKDGTKNQTKAEEAKPKVELTPEEEKAKRKSEEIQASKERALAREKERERRDRELGPIVWVWMDSAEKWRWRNWEKGVQDVGPGGWEERDWKVFADDREVWDHVADQEDMEKDEIDVHDWTC
ncbi:hypothetical protein CI109_100427 [Kwoniella shandongensis]|uniref:Uncharacterized protein n=1 Tax=Kwoniella shandongensis TaxID=1734106 RepID=A0A5M6C9B9_9TREE|nr:uncharacterized protein CI109_001729 [Kwoniella shandongensis]KAA5529789.1 hypothetical protein CI109_001729 [Kwoniella shandongensis]